MSLISSSAQNQRDVRTILLADFYGLGIGLQVVIPIGQADTIRSNARHLRGRIMETRLGGKPEEDVHSGPPGAAAWRRLADDVVKVCDQLRKSVPVIKSGDPGQLRCD